MAKAEQVTRFQFHTFKTDKPQIGCGFELAA
jgi:hypothetical protein